PPQRPARARPRSTGARRQRGLAAARGPNQKRHFAAPERQAYALESLDLSGSLAEEFHHLDSLDDGLGHRMNTIAGSMLVTCTIAAIADITHMATVSRNSLRV